MIRELPRDSRIKIERSTQGETLIWKGRDDRWNRLSIGAFLLFWLGGWFMGEILVAQKLWHSYLQGKLLEEPFLLFWLGGWTVGGILAISHLYIIIRGTRATRLELRSDELRYQDAENAMISACQCDISNLQLIRASYLMLSFDLGAKRIEVGKYLEEPEKEWLYDRLYEWLKRT